MTSWHVSLYRFPAHVHGRAPARVQRADVGDGVRRKRRCVHPARPDAPQAEAPWVLVPSDVDLDAELVVVAAVAFVVYLKVYA